VRRKTAIRLLIGIVIVLGLLVGIDRIAAAVASNQAEKYLAQQAVFTQPPSVRIGGFPFLTQAIGGRYDDIEVRSAGVELDGIPATNLKATLHGVRLPISAAFGRPLKTLTVDSASGSVTFSYPEVATLSQIPGLVITASGGQLAVSAKLAIPGLGISATVSGTGTARYDGSALRLNVTALTVAGVSVPAAVIPELESALAVPITIPALPYGLQIDAITPTTAGIVVTGSATNSVIATTQ
jgi:hypothetical protein